MVLTYAVRIEEQNKPCVTNFRLFILRRKRIVFTNIIMEREKARTIIRELCLIDCMKRLLKILLP